MSLGQTLPQTASLLARAGRTLWQIGSCTFTGKVGASLGETALDAVGTIPVANDVVHGAQIVSAIGAAGISLFGDVTGAGLSAAGAGLEIAKDTGTVIAVHGAELVPIVGNVISGIATMHDVYGVTKAYGACMSGGG